MSDTLKTFTVEVMNTLITHEEVEAYSENGAEHIARERFDAGDITLGLEHSIGIDFNTAENYQDD